MGKVNISRIIKDIHLAKPNDWEGTIIKNIKRYSKGEDLNKIKNIAVLELKYPDKSYLEQYFPFISYIPVLCLPIIMVLRDYGDKLNEHIREIPDTIGKKQVEQMINSTKENYENTLGFMFKVFIFTFVLFIVIMICNMLYDRHTVNRKKKLAVLISVIDSKANDNGSTKEDTEFKSYTIRIKEIK